LRRKYGHYVAIVGKVMGPWTLAYHLYGIQDFLMEIYTEPEKVRDFL
jgi:[methyl-Co(III) methanol-specific corrinoid protein]:coenzyme M methyltransferase